MTNDEDYYHLRMTKADLFWIFLSCWNQFERSLQESEEFVQLGLDVENDVKKYAEEAFLLSPSINKLSGHLEFCIPSNPADV